MKDFLIVVDIQNDFVDGALGTPEAVAIIDKAADKIKSHKGEIVVTYDTHFENYAETSEGRHLPVPHCIKGTDGYELHPAVRAELVKGRYTEIEKPTFGSTDLPVRIYLHEGEGPHRITLIGLCTDICVVSNALLLKAHFPESEITVDASACAGVTPESHQAALQVMRMCQIEVTGEG